MPDAHQLTVAATSNADALGYRAQQAVALAMDDSVNYRLIGGHMVRLLLELYPADRATIRSTLDADAAVDQVAVVAPAAQKLVDAGFSKQGGNAFVKDAGDDQQLEINLFLSRNDHKPGLRPQPVQGVGQVDTLPELEFALTKPGLVVNVTAQLSATESICYRTHIPDLETAVVLKAHAWQGRRSQKDLADLYSLLEIRNEHNSLAWRLDASPPTGRRLDTARILQPLAQQITRRSPAFEVPSAVDRVRMAALVNRHISSP